MSRVNISRYGNPEPGSIVLKNKVISVEGIDGSGKSSLIYNIKTSLETLYGERVFIAGQPGITYVGEQVRALIKNPELQLDPDVKVFLLAAARRDLMLQLLRRKEKYPNEFIIFDRHVDTTWVYQGVEGADEDLIEQLDSPYQNYAVHGTDKGFDKLVPDVVIYLDVDVGVARARLFKDRTEPDAYDQKGPDFFEKCKKRYSSLLSDYRSFPESAPKTTLIVVDANESQDKVFNYVKPYLGL